MSANLLDPRLHRRAGADYLAALIGDGTLNSGGGSEGLTSVVNGVQIASADLQVTDQEAAAATSGVPVLVGQVLTAWAVVTPSVAHDYYLGIDIYDGVAGDYSTFQLHALPAGQRALVITTHTAAVDGRAGLDLGSNSEPDPAIVHDIGLVRGRVPFPRVRFRRVRRGD